MDDARVWAFEESLWTGDAEQYRALVDPEVVMALPAEPFVLQGEAAIRAVQDTPRWDSVEIAQGVISRPQEGLIVIGYRATARRGEGDAYEAWCTSTYRQLGHEDWRVVQHSQVPPLRAPAAEG